MGCVCVVFSLLLQATVRPENVKTLKKQNQDLQNKFEEGVCVCMSDVCMYVCVCRYAFVDV